MENSSTLTFFKNYEVIKQIGKGAYGLVYKVKDTCSNHIYALKTIDISKTNDKTLKNTLNEIRILCSINHTNVIGYKEAFIHDNKMCVIMEFIGGGDLSGKIAEIKKNGQNITEDIIWKYTIQILNGLKALHNLKIIHRDIKSANIFLSDDHETVKVGDLNISKIVKENYALTQIGTPYYLAPEIWLNKQYDYRCDIFSLGCVMYEMSALDVPYRAESIYDLLKKFTKDTPKKIPNHYSDALYNIIVKFMEKDPNMRPTVYEALELPYIKSKIEEKQNFLNDNYYSNQEILLSTIPIPKDINSLNNVLPKRKSSETIDSNANEQFHGFNVELQKEYDTSNSSENNDSFSNSRGRSEAVFEEKDLDSNITNMLMNIHKNNKIPARTENRLSLDIIKNICSKECDKKENICKSSSKVPKKEKCTFMANRKSEFFNYKQKYPF